MKSAILSSICFANVRDAYQLMKFCKKLLSHFIVRGSFLSRDSSFAADFRFALIAMPTKHTARYHCLHLVWRDIVVIVPFLRSLAFGPEKVTHFTTPNCYRPVVGRVTRATQYRQTIEAVRSAEPPPKPLNPSYSFG